VEGVDVGRAAGLFGVSLGHRFGEILGRVGADEGDDASAESRAGHARAVCALVVLREFDEYVEFAATDLEVVFEAFVGGVHDGAEADEVVLFEAFDGVSDADVFGDDVSGAPAERFGERGFVGFEGVREYAPPRFDFSEVLFEDGEGLCAFAAALVVGGVAKVALHAGVADDDAGQGVVEGDGAVVEGCAVDP